MACCPAHDDQNPSLSISVGSDTRVLLRCFAGCSFEKVCLAMGLRPIDLFPPPEEKKLPTQKRRRIVQEYNYFDEHGTLLFQVVRYDPKSFKHRKPKTGGGWIWSTKGVRVVPYRLPELVAEPLRPVLVVEGEKDVDNVLRLGVIATCNAGGGKNWTSEHAQFLKDRRVYVLPDNDEVGRGFANKVAESLQGIAASVHIVELPNLPKSGDVSDWIEAGGTKDQLRELLLASHSVRESDQGAQASEENSALLEVEEVGGPRPYVPFPCDLLPSPAKEFVVSGAVALGCDPAYVALPLLAALASAVGNSRRIALKGSWREPCVLWTVVIGESGTLKSPALDLALEVIRKRQASNLRVYEKELENFEQAEQVYQADLQIWQKKGRGKGENPPEKPVPPIFGQVVAEDTTIEALAVLLENQPRGLLVARDELSGWLNSFDAYKSARGADVAHWLSLHRAGSLVVNRKSGRHFIYVPRAAACVCGGVQPRTLAAALGGRYSADGPEQMDKPPSEHFSNGLAARLLVAYPPRVPKCWTDSDISEAVRDAMEKRFNDLFELETSIDENEQPIPVDLPLAPDARRRFIEFFNDHAKEQCDVQGDLAAAWAKAEGYAARFGLLFALIENPRCESVSLANIEAGIELAQWFVEEAARIYSDIGGQGDDSCIHEKRQAERLVAWIRRKNGVVTVRDLTRGPRRFREDAAAAELALTELVEAGLGSFVWRGTSEDGGRPTQVFVLRDSGDGDETSKKEGKGSGCVAVATPVASS